MAKQKRIGRPRRARKPRGLSQLAPWALGAVAAGAIVLLLVYAASRSGTANDSFVAEITETPSAPQAGEAFQGGPRLYFPVAGVDLGRIPFQKVVSHVFELRNVGDSPLTLEDVQVQMLEGC